MDIEPKCTVFESQETKRKSLLPRERVTIHLHHRAPDHTRQLKMMVKGIHFQRQVSSEARREVVL